ncbi:MAG: class I SAM-dependent methyltransferase [Acidimicrobiales bacterium]
MLTVDYDRLGLRPGELLLDLGAGGGRHAYGAFARGARVVALDRSEADAKDCAAFLTALVDEADHGEAASMVGDALRLPFPDATFDRVICAEVLEHVPDDRAAMAEIARVLRPKGTAAVTVPRFWPELVCWALSDEYHLVDGGHVRIYRLGELRRRLHAAGLRPAGVGLAHGLHTPYWWLKCAVGVSNDTHPLVRAYHRLLVWDIEAGRPLPTRLAEAALNPLLAKSIVVYLTKAAKEAT